MFWGFSPALDLLELYKKENKTLPSELNILLVGGADARHILKTLAKRYRHAQTTITLNFFVAEASIETVAKQLLLLNVAFQHSEVMGLVSKTKIFMELFGNTLVRPSVAKILTSAAKELVKMVTDYDYLKKMMPFLTIDVKYKERDYLETLLQFWCGRDDFDICHSWDRRLRKSLGVRYDTKIGAFDWDLHMRLHCVGGSQVCNQEYRNFRLNGVAFSWLESEVSKPNRSMVCVVVPNGETYAHYGYLGDMRTGPFIAYGLECEDKEFLKSTHGENQYRATDVTERNLCQIFHEIQYGGEYHHQPTNDIKMGPVVMDMGERRVVDIRATEGGKKINKCIDLKGVNIKFISISLLALMQYKTEYKDLFDVVYFGAFYLKYLNKELINHVTKENAMLVIENQKYVLSYREEQLHEFEEEMKKAIDGAKVKQRPFDACKDDFAAFVKV